MALIQCPECDQQISDAAACCVHCGFPLAQVKKQDEPCDVETDQDQRPNSVVKVLPTDVDIGTLDEYWAMTTEIVDDLLNVRWHWQLAMCAGWTLVTGLGLYRHPLNAWKADNACTAILDDCWIVLVGRLSRVMDDRKTAKRIASL
jgi:hypothetical protein